MRKFLNNQSLKISSMAVVGFMAGTENAMAGGNTFNEVAENIATGIETVPGLVTGISYMAGTLLGVLGILKIKDHVENPGNTPLKDGVIRLAAGGALFAFPIISESMTTLIDAAGAGTGAEVAKVKKVEIGIQ